MAIRLDPEDLYYDEEYNNVGGVNHVELPSEIGHGIGESERSQQPRESQSQLFLGH
jgi:hypothetical protein